MIKGISQQAVVIDTPNGKVFRQAIFIVSSKARNLPEKTLWEEAQRMIEENTDQPLKRGKLFR